MILSKVKVTKYNEAGIKPMQVQVFGTSTKAKMYVCGNKNR